MTMVVCIFEGRKSNIETLIIIFTNGNSNYAVRQLEDFVPKVSYYTGVKGWMNQSLFFQYLM